MPTIVHKHEPEIRVITNPGGVTQHKVLYVRKGEDDVELSVLARLVEVCE